MKSLFYALFFLAVLVTSVILLRSLDPEKDKKTSRTARGLVVESLSPRPIDLDRGALKGATADEAYAVGMELLNLWHVREATKVFEQSVEADSSYYPAWVRLVECYSHPFVCQEDRAREAWTKALDTSLSEADTLFLLGLKDLFIDRDYEVAAERLNLAERSEVSHEDASYYTTLAVFYAGNTEETARRLEELLSKDDTVGRVVELSVRRAVADGDLSHAEERARDLARVFSEEPHPYVLLSQIVWRQGKAAEAVEFCNNALVLDPKYVPAILARGNLYAAEGNFAAARVSFEKLLLFEDPILRAFGMEGVGFVDFLTGHFDDGVSAMDEAIRFAMLAGSVRRGLSYATRLVEYLCGLGQGDAADAVVDRWITGFGDIPVTLGKLRIYLLEGDLEIAQEVLKRVESDREWLVWSAALSIDVVEMKALEHIGAGQHEAAIDLLSERTLTGSTKSGTRTFLEGYATFKNGDAETARGYFAKVGEHLFGTEIPYHGDPVLYVQSLFYLAETFIASGVESEAKKHYESFLDHWGGADWDIQATNRAREKLQNMTQADTPDQ